MNGFVGFLTIGPNRIKLSLTIGPNCVELYELRVLLVKPGMFVCGLFDDAIPVLRLMISAEIMQRNS